MPIYNACALKFHENKLPLQQGRLVQNEAAKPWQHVYRMAPNSNSIDNNVLDIYKQCCKTVSP